MDSSSYSHQHRTSHAGTACDASAVHVIGGHVSGVLTGHKLQGTWRTAFFIHPDRNKCIAGAASGRLEQVWTHLGLLTCGLNPCCCRSHMCIVLLAAISESAVQRGIARHEAAAQLQAAHVGSLLE
jgi:hypothetical protein